jgi:hypothetical protein
MACQAKAEQVRYWGKFVTKQFQGILNHESDESYESESRRDDRRRRQVVAVRVLATLQEVILLSSFVRFVLFVVNLWLGAALGRTTGPTQLCSQNCKVRRIPTQDRKRLKARSIKPKLLIATSPRLFRAAFRDELDVARAFLCRDRRVQPTRPTDPAPGTPATTNDAGMWALPPTRAESGCAVRECHAGETESSHALIPLKIATASSRDR